ncbi:MAG TPA: HDOD domain-containing protein [Burkholderiales bacterium]|nr:HDOD domain-containing protein [Burkholderiales bacterium]
MELSPLEQQQIEAIKASGLQIPPRPQVVAEVQQLLREGDADNRAIARLIGRDVRLTAAVFKTVNSAAYGLARKVDSLDKALAYLGHKQMAAVVNTAGLRQQLGGDAARFERFWERSTDLATLCSVLAERLPAAGAITPDQAYMVGLFHDCGIPLLMQHFPGYCDALERRSAPLPNVLDQDDSFGTSHCLVGQMVAEHWNLPDDVCAVIRSHHYVLDEGQQARTASALLQLAMHVYNANGGHDDSEWAYQRAAALAELAIAEDAVEAFERELWESFEILH